ncbi:MAG: hypothetical protein PQJ28_02830, partial [Spirochaetales bacterium]|nr:hypothetical protein [Spirochaetales bacterium]
GRSFEYPQFIDFFKEQQNKTPEYLILALDFFDCMVADTDFDQKKERNRETLDLATNSKLELFVKNYFTIDTLIYSFENFKRSILNKHYYRSYNENNVATCDVFPAQSVEDIATTNAAKAYSNSSYDDKFQKSLLEIINANHDSKFIVFTTPLSKPYIDSINSNPKTKELYDRWIEDMVSVFGKIYFTTFHNKLSSEYTKHSFDGTHFYQKACNKIINDIMSYEFNSPEQLSGNVIIINKNNLKQTLNTI